VSKSKSGSDDLVFVGLDVHKDSITSAVLKPRSEVPVLDRFFHDEANIRRFVSGFERRPLLRVCYEAGPTGYELQRFLTRLGVACEVIAPSLIPIAPGPRIKTDRRDARRLVHLYRLGELVAVNVPTPQQEAIRDLVRQRASFVSDRTRARHRLSKFLLRHGEVYRQGVQWTITHHRWLDQRHFSDPALSATFSHYKGVLGSLQAHLDAVNTDLAVYLDSGPFAESVTRLCAYRGVSEIGALTLSAEVCDWRRFAKATTFMGFCGLVPSEYSSGSHTSRGSITKAGNSHLRAQLIEAAWAYQHRPSVGVLMAKRQAGCSPQTIDRAWRAQLHLCGKFRRLAERKAHKNVVATAIARELAGHLWAEMALG
jgi:transposase